MRAGRNVCVQRMQEWRIGRGGKLDSRILQCTESGRSLKKVTFKTNIYPQDQSLSRFCSPNTSHVSCKALNVLKCISCKRGVSRRTLHEQTTTCQNLQIVAGGFLTREDSQDACISTPDENAHEHIEEGSKAYLGDVLDELLELDHCFALSKHHRQSSAQDRKARHQEDNFVHWYANLSVFIIILLVHVL